MRSSCGAVEAPVADGATCNPQPVASGVALRSIKAKYRLRVQIATVQARLHRWYNVRCVEEEGAIRKGARGVETGDGEALVACRLLLD